MPWIAQKDWPPDIKERHYDFTSISEIVAEAKRQHMGENSTQHLLFALCGLMEEVITSVDAIPEPASSDFDDSGIIHELTRIYEEIPSHKQLQAISDDVEKILNLVEGAQTVIHLGDPGQLPPKTVT